MAARQPSIYGGAVRSLTEIYERANKRIADVVARSVSSGRSRGYTAVQMSFQAGIQAEIDWLKRQNRAWVTRSIPGVYAGQVNVARRQIEAAGIRAATATIGQSSIHANAINVLANNLLSSLDRNAGLLERNAVPILDDAILQAATIGRRGASLVEQTGAQQLIAGAHGFRFDRRASEEFRRGALEAMTEGLVQGEGIGKISDRMAEIFKENGLPAFVDRAGRQWSLDAYATMAARTGLREAATQASARSYLEVGLDVVVVIGISTYPKSPCIPFEGTKLSLTGKMRGLKTLAEAQAEGFLHPNCIHTIGADPDQEPREDIMPEDARQALETTATSRVASGENTTPVIASTSVSGAIVQLAPDEIRLARRQVITDRFSQAGRTDLVSEVDKIPDRIIDAVNSPRMTFGSDPDKAFYTPSNATITMSKQPETWGGARSVFHHEFGHHVHHSLGIVKQGTASKPFMAAMKADLSAIRTKLIAAVGSKADFLMQYKFGGSAIADNRHMARIGAMTNPTLEQRHRIVAWFDTMGGLSKGKHGYGHKKAYYKGKGTNEVFANCYNAAINGWVEFDEDFPEIMKLIRAIMDS